MNKSNKYSLLIAAALVGVLASFQNCSKASFSTGSASIGTQSAQFGDLNGDALAQLIQNGEDIKDVPIGTTGGGNTRCHNFNGVTQPLKILVIVDNSGSTDDTDPNKAFRLNLLSTFLANYQSKANFGWNLSYFSGSTAVSLVTQGNQPSFTTGAGMSTALGQYTVINASGNTPYTQALNLLRSAIANDADAVSSYAVAFISDGMPNPAISDANLATLVQDVVKTKPGKVSLSTVYFGSPNAYQNDAPAAIARLQAMALIGGGQFANTVAAGANINFADVLTVPPSLCP